MRRLFLLLGVVVAALVAVLALRSRGAPLRYYAPEVYVERADAFIGRGHLAADCSGEAVRLVPQLDGASAADRAWYEDSYLAGDVARFNADPETYGWTFVVDADCRLRGVNPTVHAVELPFGERVRWLGHLLWNSAGSDAVLRSAERSVTLRRPERHVPTREAATTRVGADEDLVQEGVVLLHFAGGPGQPAARVFHVGGDVVAYNRVRGAGDEGMRLMGHRVPVGMLLRLETGDWLHFAAASPRRVEETFVFVGGETLDAASVVRRRNERYERETEEAGLGLVADPVREARDPWLARVAASLDHALGALPAARARELAESFDVQLTLERQAQLRLSAVFRAAVAELAGGRAVPAGMTVMDAISGDVLAMATYPGEGELAGDDTVLEARARRRLLRNQNLVRHPIGSAVKPFLFAAIADAYPGLLAFELAGHEPVERHRELFHCLLPTGYQLLAGHLRPLDFRTALEVSCNEYTVELATLALAVDAGLRDGEAGPVVPLAPALSTADGGSGDLVWPPPGTTSGVSIAGRPLGGAPDLGDYVFVEPLPESVRRDPEIAAIARCEEMDRLEQLRWRDALERLTGAATYAGRVPQGLPGDATRGQLEQGYVTNRYDLGPWASLLARLSEGADEDTAWAVRAALQEVSPERVDLAFNQVTRLRADFVSMLLGGGTSTWTNLQLAEAMSRLVTGRAVEARLVSRVLDRGDERTAALVAAERQPAPPLDIDPAARGAVLDGLRRVVTGATGTARELRPAVAALERAFPGERLLVFSKTGSPVVERAVPAVAGRALEALVARGRLRWSGDAPVARAGERTAPYARAGAPGRDAYLQTLAAALAELGYRRDARWLLPIFRRATDDLVAQLAEGVAGSEVDGPLRVVRGALATNRDDGLFRQRLVKDQGAVYVLTVLRTPAGTADVPTPEELAGPDVRGLTVAIHLEAGEDSRHAVAVARRVLPELVPLLR